MIIGSNLSGIDIRMSKIFGETRRSFIIPLDHVICDGVMDGLSNIQEIIDLSELVGANAIVLRPNALRKINYNKLALIIHLTTRMTALEGHIQINSVKKAISYGADAICVEIKIGLDE